MARKTRNKKLLQLQSETISSQTYLACIYARLSLENGGKEGDSIQNQISVCKEFIQTMPDTELVSVYSDNGYTGTSFNRPAWNQMMNEIRVGRINTVIVRDLSRFGRDYVEAGNYLEKIFPALKIRFISVNDRYDSLYGDSAEVSLNVLLNNMVNTMYARDISKKIITSIDIRQRNKTFRGPNVPYGYVWNDDHTAYAIDEEAAYYVKSIFEWKLHGLSAAEIVRKLNQAGVEPPEVHKIHIGLRKGSPATTLWGESTIRQMLKNSAYVGEIVHGKQRSMLFKGIPCHKQLQSDWIVYKNMHPAIISQEVFDRVQCMLQQSSNDIARKKAASAAARESIINLFHGKVYCGDCGTELCLRRHRIHNTAPEQWTGYYNCKGYEKKKPHICRSHRIDREKLNHAVWKAIQESMWLVLQNENIVRSLLQRISEESIHYQIKEDRLLKRKKCNEIRKRNAYENFSSGKATEIEYWAEKHRFDRSIAQIEQELFEVKKQRNERQRKANAGTALLMSMQDYKDVDKLTQEMVDTFIERIVVYENRKIEIIFQHQDIVHSILSNILEKGIG